MKKLLSIILALMLVLSMTSCSMLGAVFGAIENELEEEIVDNIIGGIGVGSDSDGHDYTNFTPSEKALFEAYFGGVIPFVPNDEYYVEEYEYDWGDSYEYGINFYTFDNTKTEFNSYKSQFSVYSFDGTDIDEYGDTWYLYTSDEGFYIDLSYYLDENGYYVIDVYVYYLDDGSESGGGSGSITESGIITNEGAGLPTGVNGVHRVDFTKADKVKDVTDQYYYIDGCPTTGTVPVLVIPIEFSDVTAKSKGYTIDNIERAFTGDDTDYYSVEEYYYISSYGQFDLEFTIVDQWFKPSHPSTYYENLTESYYGEEFFIGDQAIMDEALKYLSKTMDLSKFDSDNNGLIDAVIMINTLDVDDSSDFYWAFRYWNYYTDSNDSYYEYDGVIANDYLWASYAFMHEKYDEDSGFTYDDTGVMNTNTYIHEFAHVIGAEDYYNTDYESETSPLDGCDIMDVLSGDHNPYTKFVLGWITSSRLVTTKSSVTLTLESFTETGDSIIIGNNWDEKLGLYQEYYIVVYYTMTGLNGGEYGYFAREGIIVYHVNSSLYCDEYYGETYYEIYNNNTSYTGEDGYGTKDNLIEFIKSADDTFTYIEGDSLPSQIDDNGDRLAYSFTVESFEDGKATLTFTKN